MDIPAAPSPAICQLCQEKADLDFDFTMAFQPIVDCSQRTLFGYEPPGAGAQQRAGAERD
ncbi:hypothetical protein [Aeromonas caviae]